MATVIKIDKNIEIKGCASCPFINFVDEYMFGELDGRTFYCGLYDGYTEKTPKDVIDLGNDVTGPRKDKPKSCPIIEIKSE